MTKKGFTLVELMLVVTIIAILAAIAVPNFSRLIRQAQEARTKANLASLRAAITLFYSDTETTFPTDHLQSLVPKYLRDIPLKYTPRYHPEGNTVSAGPSDAQTDASGDWFYVNKSSDTYFGKISVNCIHTDIKGVSWSSY